MKSIEILKKGNEHVKGYIMPIIFTKDGALKLYKTRENSLYIWLKYVGNRRLSGHGVTFLYDDCKRGVKFVRQMDYWSIISQLIGVVAENIYYENSVPIELLI